MVLSRDTFTIRYMITGQRDGSWIIEAFDSRNQKLGTAVYVQTPDEAYKIWLCLNGYGGMEPDEIRRTIEDTEILELEDIRKSA